MGFNFILSTAERFDFILNANQQLGSYWIQVRLTGPCASREIIQLGILRYAGSTVTEPQLTRPTYNTGLPIGTAS